MVCSRHKKTCDETDFLAQTKWLFAPNMSEKLPLPIHKLSIFAQERDDIHYTKQCQPPAASRQLRDSFLHHTKLQAARPRDFMTGASSVSSFHMYIYVYRFIIDNVCSVVCPTKPARTTNLHYFTLYTSGVWMSS